MRRLKATEWNGQACLKYMAPKQRIESEKSLMMRIVTAVAAAGVMVLRNNVGVAKMPGGFVRYGLGVGSPDLVGIVPPHGRFIGIEVKRPKKSRIGKAQEQWHAVARRYGAVVGIVDSVEGALALVEQARG